MQKKWWHGKVAYQIYPKSFYDTTGNGIGDIRGIINKLDYLKNLGVDIVWLSPCYCSPLADQGYDISDYFNIDPKFGTMEDMDELIAEAKKRDIYILMDLVVNHCSDEHVWFQKAMADLNSEEASYFYIEDGVNGHEPNNWRSYFGGSVWEKIPGTDKYYLHLFHKKQPDLNWENPKLREKIFEMINWWLDKGLAGFRIDAIINIKKALPFTKFSYPPDRDDGMVSCTRFLEDADVNEFLGMMRDRCFAKYDAFTAGEVFNEHEDDIPNFIGDNGYFSTMYDFNPTLVGKSQKGWYDARPITPEEYKLAVFETQEKIGDIAYISTIIENHDEPRGVSHYIPKDDLNDRSKKFLATMQFMQRGLPFIYQGQEIGMENVDFKGIQEIDDISTLDEYKVALHAGYSEDEAFRIVKHFSRDNARTPFQWDGSENAGFTTGTPWLKLNPNYTSINLDAQIHDEESVFQHYRRLIALRKSKEYGDVVVYGAFLPYQKEEKNLMAFYRKTADKTLLVLGNFQNEPKVVTLPSAIKNIVLDNIGMIQMMDNTHVKLEGYQALVIEI